MTRGSRPPAKPISEDERQTVIRLAARGESAGKISATLRAKGIHRSAPGIARRTDYAEGRRDFLRSQAEAAEAALAAAEAERAAAHRRLGVRHPAFPRVTLPRLSIQAGWAE